MSSFDLGWGEPVCVRQALNTLYKPSFNQDILSMGYAPDDGNEELIRQIKMYLYRTTGIDYENIIITNGTTPSINVVLRTLKGKGFKKISTRDLYFPYYPDIIAKNGFEHTLGFVDSIDTLNLIDSPSNPEGEIILGRTGFNHNIWDSVYYNPVYINELNPPNPFHLVNVGSLSKVFGLTGLRIGYIATNRDEDARKFSDENLYESCTISVPSQRLAEDILGNLDQDIFFKMAQTKVNYNRDEISKLGNLFHGQEVPKNGMFYSALIDDSALKIFCKANVDYVLLSSEGKTKRIRLNLAQDNQITKDAIKAIKRIDSGR